MRLHGWCTRCHRVRLVHVTVPPVRGVPMGTCTECEDNERRGDAQATNRQRRG